MWVCHLGVVKDGLDRSKAVIGGLVIVLSDVHQDVHSRDDRPLDSLDLVV